MPSFEDTPLTDTITEFALSLLSMRGDEVFASGTAIVVAPHLALTARHVIEDLWSRYERSSLVAPIGEHPEVAGTFSLQAMQILDSGRVGVVYDVTRLWTSPHTDIAALQLTTTSPYRQNRPWRTPKISLLPPEPNSRIYAFGFRSSQVDIHVDESINNLVWHDAPTTASGEVIELHLVRRDRARLTFPCFQTNARFDGGMSGGPVFNDDGRLCGLVCSNLPPISPEDDHVSYVSLLWPAMGILLDLPLPSLPVARAYPLLELARQGLYMDALGWERVELVLAPNGTISQVRLCRPPGRSPAHTA